jgi:hypothetical protein
VIVGLFLFSVLTALMIALLVIVLLLYRGIKLLERVVDLLSDAQGRERLSRGMNTSLRE